MRFLLTINPTYLRIALLAGSLVVWALTGYAGDETECC